MSDRKLPLTVRWGFIAIGLWCLALQIRNSFLTPGDLGLLFGPVQSNIALSVMVALIAARVIRRPEHRLPWALLAGAVLAWTFGNAWFAAFYWTAEVVPIPSPADIGYLAFCPLAAAGLVYLLRADKVRLSGAQLVDGAAAGLAIAAVNAAIVFDTVAASAEGSRIEIITSLSYPVVDIVLLATCVGAVASRGWDLDRRWLLIGGGLVLFSIADSMYLVDSINETYAVGVWYDGGWHFALAMIAFAAWQPVSFRDSRSDERMRRAVMPLVFAAAALGLLVYGTINSIGPVPSVLAVVSMVALLARLLLTHRENIDMLKSSRHEAVTDSLTGLQNRRGLTRALDGRAEGILLLFDLDGFKNYNDSFGHPAGDALLKRLGGSLVEHLGDTAEAFRMGGDEFCVLYADSTANPETLGSACAEALSEQGEGFRVGCSFGYCILPDEAEDATEAMRVADHRLYAMKNSGRMSPERQSKEVLLRALAARSPQMEGHLNGVAVLAEATAARMGLQGEELDQVRHAAELHDIGKVGIPDAILDKPGKLDEHEWAFMRRHTLIGERIIGAAPSLGQVAKLVRSSHERWDGGGYPDGLAATSIPLGARIIAVADAFDAMTVDRPYSRARTVDEAVAELRRCSGTQFDPEAVDRFSEVIAEAPPVLRGEVTAR